MKKVVLAYSGGLDTSVAVAWLQGAVRRRGRHPDRGPRRRLAARGRRGAGHEGRRQPRLRHRWPGALRAPVRLAQPPGQRAVPGRLPARHRAGAAAHRPAPRRGRRPRARRRRRPWLHRQGQRPGPLRRRRPCARPAGSRSSRPMRVGHGPLARAGDRLRHRARHRDPHHEGLALLDRRRTSGAARARPASSRIPGPRRRRTPTSGPSTQARRRTSPPS